MWISLDSFHSKSSFIFSSFWTSYYELLLSLYLLFSTSKFTYSSSHHLELLSTYEESLIISLDVYIVEIWMFCMIVIDHYQLGTRKHKVTWTRKSKCKGLLNIIFFTSIHQTKQKKSPHEYYLFEISNLSSVSEGKLKEVHKVILLHVNICMHWGK